MTKRVHSSLALLPWLLMAALPSAAQADEVAIQGKPLSSDPQGTLKQLLQLMPVVSGCKEKPSAVIVALAEKSDDIRASADGRQLVSGWAKESWTFDACQRQVPMFVTYRFQPDGRVLYQFSGR